MIDPANDLGFEPVGYRLWQKQVERVLKGEDFERRLVSRSYDGLRIAPLYPPGQGKAQPWRAESGRWRVSQRVDHPTIAAARDLALKDLEGGADALTVVASGAASARGFGVPIRTLDELDGALSGVLLDGIEVRLDAGEGGIELASLLAALAERRGHPSGEVAFDFGIDPLGAGLGSGWLPRFDMRLPDLVADFRRRGFCKRILLCDGRPHHEAGSSEAQELAGVLATGLAYMRLLEAAGHAPAAGRDALSFLLVADADQFLTTAKFRAMRRLWARIEELCGLECKPIHVHAETSWRMKTRRDPWVNMLRETVAVTSAGLGGADTITALPFTSALGLPDAFARRVARNTQLILLDEAHLWRVADPAAGAGGIEALTEALCEKAWALLRTVEGEGGLIESVMGGTWQRMIAVTRQERERAAATLADPITGTSSFPDLSEKPISVLRPMPNVGTLASGPAHRREASRIAPLVPIRNAQAFELLRDRADAVLSATGARPTIQIVSFGPRTASTAKAAYAKNLFESGGIKALEQTIASLDECSLAFRTSGASAVCLCSSEEIYQRPAENAAFPGETSLEEIARLFQHAGCARLYVASDAEAPQYKLKLATFTDLIHHDCNAVKLLDKFYYSN